MIHLGHSTDFAIMKLVHVSVELDMMAQSVISAHLVTMDILGVDLVIVNMPEVNQTNAMEQYVAVMNLDNVNAR